MTRLSTLVIATTLAAVLSSPALADRLNPQPLPPRHGPVVHVAPQQAPQHRTFSCTPPRVARHVKVHGHYVWRCVRLKVV